MVTTDENLVGASARSFAALAPDLSVLGPHLGRPVQVRRFAAASIAWLNHRWFAEAGFNLSIDDVRHRVEAWLLSTYGVGIVGPHDPEDRYSGPPTTLYADRYGNANGSGHGGSGRVAGRRGFQAKGIGRTPLVSPFADWFHSNGCLWLEEGVREIVFAELGAAEFPHGAVPVLALIDTGDTYHWPDGNPGPHRAIMVRADFVRLAHLQRSIFFGTSGLPGSDQLLDALRTRDSWAWFLGKAEGRKRAGVEAGDLGDVFRRIGEQHGHAHAWRLWPGPFFSSNVSLDGQLVDFGSMRALPSWKRARGRTKGHGFGEEHLHVASNAQSLARLATKFGNSVAAEELLEHYWYGRRRKFNESLTSCGETSARSLKLLFEEQQRQVVPLQEDTSACWPTVGLASDGDLASTRQFLEPRTALFYDRLVDDAKAMTDTLVPGSELNRPAIENFIRRRLTHGRRTWGHLPTNFVLLAQACDAHWAWLVGRRTGSSETVVIVAGIIVENQLEIAGHRIDLTEVIGCRSTRWGSWLSVTLPTDDRGNALLGSRTLLPPDELFTYSDP